MDNDRAIQRDAGLLVGLVLGGAVVFLVAVAAGAALDAEPGSLADWIAAVATFAALIAASYAAVQTSRTFRLEQNRDRQRDRAVRQRQAELVAVWAGRITHRGPLNTVTFAPGSSVGQTTRGPGVVYPESIPVTIRNASEVPVYDLTVDVYIGDSKVEEPVLGGRYKVVDVQNGLAVLGTLADVEVVTPELVESMVRVIETRPGADDEPSPIVIGWSFRDNAGVRWSRLPGGRLEEQTPTT